MEDLSTHKITLSVPKFPTKETTPSWWLVPQPSSSLDSITLTSTSLSRECVRDRIFVISSDGDMLSSLPQPSRRQLSLTLLDRCVGGRLGANLQSRPVCVRRQWTPTFCQ